MNGSTFGATFALVFCFATLAHAGAVTVVSTEARIVYFESGAGDPRQTQTATPLVNEINDLRYAPTAGAPRGDARVFWSIQEFLGGLQIFADVDHETFPPPSGSGGNASFLLSFTSAVPLDYDFEASGRDLPASFAAAFDGIAATLRYAGDGAYEGTIPVVDAPTGPEPGTLARTGTLEAGVTHTLELSALTLGTQVEAENSADGFVRLNLVPSTAVPIPLPPALVPAAAALAALPTLCRRRRQT